MWFLALTVVLSATPRHLAVAPRDSDAAIGDLERAVRDALRVALPGDRIDTADDLTAADKAQIDFAHPRLRTSQRCVTWVAPSAAMGW